MQSTTLRDFFRAILSSWLLGMSGSLSVPLTVAAVFVPNELAKVLLGVTAFICFWGAAYTVWRREREARNESNNQCVALAAKLAPKIAVSIENSGVLEIPLTDGTMSKWIQVIVKSTTNVPLRDCEVWIKDITRLNHDQSDMVSIFDEPTRCEWSQRAGPEAIRFTIPAGITQRANLFKIFNGTSRNYAHIRFRQNIRGLSP